MERRPPALALTPAQRHRRGRARHPGLHRRRSGRQRRHRAAAILVLAAAAFAAGALLAAAGTDRRALASAYARAWARGDYPAMYRLLAPRSRRRLAESAFASRLRAAAATATVRSLAPLAVAGPRGSLVTVRMRVRTRLFGVLREPLRVYIDGAGTAIRFTSTLLLPGLRPGEALRRHSVLPARGAILAANGVPLAEGPYRYSPIPQVAQQIVGTLGPIPATERAAYLAAGYPRNAQVGQDGLELIFQRQLAGRPGATLFAGRRVLARAAPQPGATVRTTIEPALEQAAVAALGGHYGGLVALDPRTGGVLAAVGLAFTDVQPPGSTFKIITASAALSAGLVTPQTSFPVQTAATIDGYILHNASGEACGGTLVNAFAVSCNSVYAPLGVRIGAARLVAMAERFGFDRPPPFPTALRSTIPSASSIGSALALGSSAIGQGRVLASPLEMADAAAAIADGGRRPVPTLLANARPRFVPVVSARVADEVQQMMLAVVRYGTGTSAQIPGVAVAGKTGTAETRNTGGRNIAADTDSWFVAYAPAGAPRIVACAMFPAAGYGATTAAPAVRQVLISALAG
jgi:peptidoglycan glycosyltransferase